MDYTDLIMKKNIITIVILAVIVLAFVFGQGIWSRVFNYGPQVFHSSPAPKYALKEASMMRSGAAYNYEDVSMDMPMYSAMGGGDSGSPEAANINNIERKLVKRANVRLRVDNLDQADTSITVYMIRYDAYAASSEIDENSRRYSLRVPAQDYDTFLREISGLGRMLHRSENTEDVTLRYYDLEGRLATKKELLKTFQSYLGKAANIDEILSVEVRIAEMQSDIEGTGMQLRNLANKVDYATIELNLLGPVELTLTQKSTLGERIKELLGNFTYFLSTAAVVLTGIVIFGIPIVVLAALLFWLLFGRVGLLIKLWRFIMKKNEKDTNAGE